MHPAVLKCENCRQEIRYGDEANKYVPGVMGGTGQIPTNPDDDWIFCSDECAGECLLDMAGGRRKVNARIP